MASGDHRSLAPAGLDGAGLRAGIVRARWNAELVDRLADGVRRGVESLGATVVEEVTVPGCFEVPLGCSALATSGSVDAIVCIGAVIRGETTHYEIVSGECARGVQDVQLRTHVPIGFGVLTVENEAQALARSEGPGGHNVGEESAWAAIEMAALVADHTAQTDRSPAVATA